MWNQVFKGGDWSGRTKSGINLELCLSLLIFTTNQTKIARELELHLQENTWTVF